MYVYMSDVERLVREMGQGVDESLERVTEQLMPFIDDTDWAMVIKLHAAIEAMITQVILAHTNQESLRSVIERLPLSDNQTGKGRIATALGLITSSQFAFLRKFSELRNSLVHRVENLDVNLKDYFAGLDREQKKSWRTAIAWTAKGGTQQTSLAETLDGSPKTTLFLGTLLLVSHLAIDEQTFLAKRQVAAISEETIRELMAEHIASDDD